MHSSCPTQLWCRGLFEGVFSPQLESLPDSWRAAGETRLLPHKNTPSYSPPSPKTPDSSYTKPSQQDTSYGGGSGSGSSSRGSSGSSGSSGNAKNQYSSARDSYSKPLPPQEYSFSDPPYSGSPSTGKKDYGSGAPMYQPPPAAQQPLPPSSYEKKHTAVKPAPPAYGYAPAGGRTGACARYLTAVTCVKAPAGDVPARIALACCQPPQLCLWKCSQQSRRSCQTAAPAVGSPCPPLVWLGCLNALPA